MGGWPGDAGKEGSWGRPKCRQSEIKPDVWPEGFHLVLKEVAVTGGWQQMVAGSISVLEGLLRLLCAGEEWLCG